VSLHWLIEQHRLSNRPHSKTNSYFTRTDAPLKYHTLQ
jgi:hypothetical protein